MKFSMRSYLQFSSGVFMALMLTIAGTAQAAPNDFNSDGYSDYTLVTIGSDDNLTWSYQDAISGASTSLGAIGISGDHLIPASWKGGASTQIGVVSLDETGTTVVWKILNADSVVEQRDFGTKKSTILSGADFNGNGYADAAIAVLKSKKVSWEISSDPFNRAVGQESIAKITFGQSGDRIFFASPDGISDWLGTFGKDSKGRALLRLKSTLTGEIKSSTRMPKSFTQSSRPRPFPVKQSDGIDALGFAVQGKTDTKIYVRSIAGDVIATTTLPGKGDIVIGNYSDAAGEEIAIKTSTGFTVFNPFTQVTSTVVTTSGIATDEININTLANASTPTTPTDGDGGDSDGGSSPSNGTLDCSSVAPWPGSHIYKTIGSHHFTDVRRNTSGIIVKPGGRGPFPGCVNIIDTKGNVLAKMGSYPPGPGWAARFYAGIGCGASTPYNGAKVAGLAKSKTGSTSIYANFGSVCYGPIDATKCLGSSSC